MTTPIPSHAVLLIRDRPSYTIVGRITDYKDKDRYKMGDFWDLEKKIPVKPVMGKVYAHRLIADDDPMSNRYESLRN